MGDAPSRPTAVDELPEMPELSAPGWFANLPAFADDLFGRRYQGLLRWSDGSAVAYRNRDLRSLMVDRDAGNMPASLQAAPLNETMERHAEEWEHLAQSTIFAMNPPLHPPARQLLARQLTRGRVAHYRELAEEVVREATHEALAARELDYQREYAGRIAARFWRRLFGLSAEEEEALPRLADRVTQALRLEYSASEAIDVDGAAREYREAFSSAIAREVRGGRNALLSEMAAELEGIDLPDKPAGIGDFIAGNLIDGLHTIKVAITNVV